MDLGQDVIDKDERPLRRSNTGRLLWILGLLAGIAIGAAAAFGLASV